MEMAARGGRWGRARRCRRTCWRNREHRTQFSKQQWWTNRGRYRGNGGHNGNAYGGGGGGGGAGLYYMDNTPLDFSWTLGLSIAGNYGGDAGRGALGSGAAGGGGAGVIFIGTTLDVPRGILMLGGTGGNGGLAGGGGVSGYRLAARS